MKQHIFIPFALILLLSTSLTRAIDDEADIPPAGTIPVENEFEIDDPHSDIEEEQQHARWNVFNSLQLSKKTKVKLIKAAICTCTLVYSLGMPIALFASIDVPFSDDQKCYYCTNSNTLLEDEVSSEVVNCTSPYFIPGPPRIEESCEWGASRGATFTISLIGTISVPFVWVLVFAKLWYG